MSTVMNTFSLRAVDLAAPHWNGIDLGDIAVSLSRLPRCLGHTGSGAAFLGARLRSWGGIWSVAQHSLYVRELVEHFLPGTRPLPVARAYALLHDAHEAYVGDLISPVKRLMRDRGFDFDAAIAAPIQRAIHESFVLPPSPHAEIARAVADADRAAWTVEEQIFLRCVDLGMAGRPLGDPPTLLGCPLPSVTLRQAAPEVIAELFENQVRADLAAATRVIAGDIAAESALRLEAALARDAGGCWPGPASGGA